MESTERAEALDRIAHATMARWITGLSPAARALAWFDWATHLAISPGKRTRLLGTALQNGGRLARYAVHAADSNRPICIEPLPQDRRFTVPAWKRWPFNLIHQGFLLNQQWWHNATTGVRGVSPHHEALVTFAGRQWLDMFSPSNFPTTNPEVLQHTLASGGANLVSGALHLLEDARDLILDKPPAAAQPFLPGKAVALSPGKVVFRNRLIELIQYAPITETVHAEPILIVPSWIMKYYILDLSPANSMVKYLVGEGHTVFMISWKNPDRGDRDVGMDDYRTLGVMDALKAVNAIVPERRVHAVGYCLGGTLLSIAAAAMARESDDRLRSLTLLAAEVDFRNSGELSLFIDESQLAWLEDIMRDDGYLDGKRMEGAFQLLNSRDLIWSRRVREYLLGERQPLFDLMAWNLDATRMPLRMHSEYLRNLFLNNELAEGHSCVDGRPVVLSDLQLPVFAVATVRDHVAPWQSVFQINLLTRTEVTFVLTSGGHNAGVVSEPGRPGRSFQVATARQNGLYVDPDTWQATVPVQEGSWWPAWEQWLAKHSGGRQAPPSLGAADGGYRPLGEAPGTYVLMR